MSIRGSHKTPNVNWRFWMCVRHARASFIFCWRCAYFHSLLFFLFDKSLRMNTLKKHSPLDNDDHMSAIRITKSMDLLPPRTTLPRSRWFSITCCDPKHEKDDEDIDPSKPRSNHGKIMQENAVFVIFSYELVLSLTFEIAHTMCSNHSR